jgi:hypothetical protein
MSFARIVYSIIEKKEPKIIWKSGDGKLKY